MSLKEYQLLFSDCNVGVYELRVEKGEDAQEAGLEIHSHLFTTLNHRPTVLLIIA
jgi:hypothetical protein